MSLFDQNIMQLYNTPIKSLRSGDLFMAFSYPTKISPETIAIYILTHTKPGDTVLDVFGGSGTTGLATLLCDTPNKKLLDLVSELNLDVEFGPRKAIISELSGLGAFVSQIMTSKVDSKRFKVEADSLIERVKNRVSTLYDTHDDEGNKGIIRHVIHTEFLICPSCKKETSFGEACVKFEPVSISSHWQCLECNQKHSTQKSERVMEFVFDPFLEKEVYVRKRRPFLIYGKTKKKSWRRKATETDFLECDYSSIMQKDVIPISKMNWGDLHRNGYHEGINFLHDFYTSRNLTVISVFWDEIKRAKKEFHDALKLWILSYNAAHSTKMTRVVLKKDQKDFILTGAQPGVLYISSLPVEKNIINGLQRKITTFKKAFETVEFSNSSVKTFWGSSSSIQIPNRSIDYVFTDPPFGDYIPYSELNFISEAWLGRITNNKEEAIISNSQGKDVSDYEALLTSVFREVQRVTKQTSYISVVFHSASSKVWNALYSTFNNSDLIVTNSSVLDKHQASFKQTNSTISVKGDAVLLLTKGKSLVGSNLHDVDQIIEKLISDAILKNDPLEVEKERLYSRYVGHCMSNQIEIGIDAKEFYSKVTGIQK
mgnify:CR=1 FL=1